jgi:dolichyl-diphosphooligosaccharide--protein glycosyltransferase
MATHDAYTWLAGAEGINRYTGRALSELLRFLHGATGVGISVLGFWLPALMAPFVVFPVAWLAVRLREPEAALASALLAAGSLGFLLRTRVGFLDTDVLTLFFPAALAVGLVAWLDPWCERSWIRGGQHESRERSPEWRLRHWIGAGFLGLVIHGYVWFYGKPHVAFALLLMAFALGLYFAAPGQRKPVAAGLLIVLSAGLGGLPGIGIAAAVIACAHLRPKAVRTWPFMVLLAAVVLGAAGMEMVATVQGIVEKLLIYAKVSSPPGKDVGLELPAIAQSIREAQNVNWTAMAERMAGHWGIFALALLGYLYLIWRRPLFLILLPLLALGVLSVKLGNRFSMFGGVAAGIGIAFGINRAMIDLGQARVRRWIVQGILFLIVLWPLWSTAQSLRPNPILPKVYAKTLIEAGEISPEGAQLWQWWDYGYAAQYYAARRTFGDGGKHSGKFLYPLALVHATDSPLQAGQMIKFVASAQMRHYRQAMQNGTYPYQQGKATAYSDHPLLSLRSMEPREAQTFVQSLARKEQEWPENLPEQYFVLSWENLRLASWISYYGNWDLVSGEADPGKIHQVRGQARFNLQEGMLQLPRKDVPLLKMDVIGKDGRRHMDFQNSRGVYAILNRLSRELYIMDGTIYNSLMVQMLIGDPADYSEHFELMTGHFPWTRVYRVK